MQPAVGAEVVVGDVEVLVAAPEGTCCAQSSGEGPLCMAAGAAQEQGQGVAQREGAEEFVLAGVEGGQSVDLLVEPAREEGFVGVGAQVGEGEIAGAGGGKGLGVGVVPVFGPVGAPPGVDLVQSALVAVGQGAFVASRRRSAIQRPRRMPPKDSSRCGARWP